MAEKIDPKKRKAPKPNGPVAGIGDNSGDEKALRDALQLRLVGYRAQHNTIDTEIEVLADALKEKKATRKAIRTAIEGAGMPLDLFDESREDALTSQAMRDRKEELRGICREAFGLPERQQALPLGATMTDAEAAVHWRAEGKRLGLAGAPCIAPPGMPPERLQDFNLGWGEGQTVLAMALQATPVVTAGADAEATRVANLSDEELDEEADRLGVPEGEMSRAALEKAVLEAIRAEGA
jgi:hypothetical protein